MIKISETKLYNIFFCSRRRETGHKLSLPFQLFSAIIQAASGRSGAVIGKFSAHGARIRSEIRIFPFAWVNEVSEVSAGGIMADWHNAPARIPQVPSNVRRDSAFSLSRLYPGTVCIEEIHGREGWMDCHRPNRTRGPR